MADDDVTIRLRAVGTRQFKREIDKDARSVDNLGDQFKQAARKARSFNAETSKSRVSIGPFSTSVRFAALGVGALTLATGKAATGLLGFAEASATAIGGAGAAGGVGLTALAQGMGTVKLATAGLSDALGGNEKALAKLNPAQARFVAKLQSMQPLLDKLRNSASGGLLGGAGKGLTSASKNFGVLNKIVRNTSGTLGGLAASAGKQAGSKKFGADLATVGAANVKIIGNLGRATLSLASATADVLVSAGPLAVWLSEMAKRGAALTAEWVANARATGKMSDFFKRAKTDLALLGSITGHTASGLINLFGAKDVDGTKTLASLDAITARFERWTRSPAVQGGLGQAIIDQIPKAAGGIATALTKAMPGAAWMAAKVFVKSFWNADAWGKVGLGGALALKLGVGKKALDAALGGAKGGKGGAIAALASRGSSPANPLWVQMVGGPPGPPKPNQPPGILGWAKGALKTGLGVGATVLGGKIAGDKLDKKLKGPQHRNQPHNPSNAVGRWVAKHLNLPSFDAGGVVPGPAGAPRAIIAHGGETVTPMPNMNRPIVVTSQLVVDRRVLAEAVHRHNTSEKARH